MTKPATLKAAPCGPQICTVRIELMRTQPVIWREVEMVTASTLHDLHDVIQTVMPWDDDHLWEFTVDRRKYGPKLEGGRHTDAPLDAGALTLRKAFASRTLVIRYLYDFGDSWTHTVTLSRLRLGAPDMDYPHYLGGERAGPPEDCGGTWGFYGLLDALANPEHPEHGCARDQLEGYDPNDVNEAGIRAAFKRMAGRRGAPATEGAVPEA